MVGGIGPVRELDLPFGSGELTLRLPQAALMGVYVPEPIAACADVQAEVDRALSTPVGTPRLPQIVGRGERVVVLVDDHTRMTPVSEILPPVLRELSASGVPDDEVTILITHGTHRLSTEAEVRRKVGPDILRRFRVVQHDCRDEANQVYVGLTSRGTPVWVNRCVTEADRRIGIGHIGPSPYAGYSGGYKLILPGVAALDTVDANHSLVPLSAGKPGVADSCCRSLTGVMGCQATPGHFATGRTWMPSAVS